MLRRPKRSRNEVVAPKGAKEDPERGGNKMYSVKICVWKCKLKVGVN